MSEATESYVEPAVRLVLDAVAAFIIERANMRLDEIGDGPGCETAAARSREAGRLQVAHEDLWDAFRLPRPEPADS